MINLFALDNDLFNDVGLFEKTMSRVSESRRKRVESLIPQDKKNSCLAAGVILPLALLKMGIDGGICLSEGEYGKPYITSPQGIFFNISHSGKWTVIALSDGEVGCDIQKVDPVDVGRLARIFSDGEREFLSAAGNSADCFYRLWTAKESYLKAIGVGLNRPMNGFTVKLGGGGGRVICGGDTGWLVSEIDFREGYRLAVCAREFAPLSAVCELTLN